MDVRNAIKEYMNKMVSDVTGLKVLLLDSETTKIVSSVFTQSQIAQKDVLLIQKLDNESKRNAQQHLKAIVFIRPTSESIKLLAEELREAKYGEYHVYFSYIAKTSIVEELAEADVNEMVKNVQEYYADYYSINNDFFTLDIPSYLKIQTRDRDEFDSRIFDRACDGICSVLLSLKKNPIIRAQDDSEITRKVAAEVSRRIDAEKVLFDFRKPATGDPLLLILDRKDDPVTPLLTQWTYQAMVHDLLTISHSRVDMKDVKEVRSDMKEIVLNQDLDHFYKDNLFQNFGDLGINLKNMVDEYQKKANCNQNLQSITEMKRFVEEYPEFQKYATHVIKHVTLTSELSKIVDKRRLFEVSELEQDLACNEDQSAASRRIMEVLSNPDVQNSERIRLAFLYVLKYEKSASNTLTSIIDILHAKGVSVEDIRCLSSILKLCGHDVRQGDLFGNKNFWKVAKKTIQREVKGVTNVFTQHQPLLVETIDLVLKGKLSPQLFPVVRPSKSDASIHNAKFSEIIVYIVGGATYEEARAVSVLNSNNTGVKIILGGTTVLNSSEFVEEIRQFDQNLNLKRS